MVLKHAKEVYRKRSLNPLWIASQYWNNNQPWFIRFGVHPGTYGKTLQGQYLTIFGQLDQTQCNTRVNHYMEGISIIGFDVYGRIFTARLVFVVSGGVEKKSYQIWCKMINIQWKEVYKITVHCNPTLMNECKSILLHYISLFLLFILMFHFIHGVWISAFRQTVQGYPTTIFSTTNAADTDAAHQWRWYEATIRGQRIGGRW